MDNQITRVPVFLFQFDHDKFFYVDRKKNNRSHEYYRLFIGTIYNMVESKITKIRGVFRSIREGKIVFIETEDLVLYCPDASLNREVFPAYLDGDERDLLKISELHDGIMMNLFPWKFKGMLRRNKSELTEHFILNTLEDSHE